VIRWEYYVLYYRHTKEGWRWSVAGFTSKTLEEVLRRMGAEGWKRATVTAQRLSEVSFGSVVDEFEYIFKRPEW
jgi:hypothetical protein